LGKTKPPRILIAPLDWGLGHATRCIPLIRELSSMKCEVWVAAEGESAALLRSNFPDLKIIALPGYGIRYSKTRWGFPFRIIGQIPKIIRAIFREHRWLAELLKREKLDLIISDNRYGLYSGSVRSVIMTHQLQVLSGLGTLPDYILRKCHYAFLSRFHRCWVIDQPGKDNLGGKLSHPPDQPAHVQYLGILSQFESLPPTEQKKHVLILLSGPEPMRSQLEATLLDQAGSLPAYRFTVVAGTPHKTEIPPLPSHITYFPFMDAARLQVVIQQAKLVICRSGYSTLMDLTVLKKRALLIPTPGQTEQEYLGKRLMKEGLCLTRFQKVVNLKTDIPDALTYPGLGSITPAENVKLGDILRELIKK